MRTTLAAIILAAFVAIVPPSASAAGGDITVTCSTGGGAGGCSGGWYTVPVTIHFSITPNPGNSISNPQGCGDLNQSGDTAGVSQTCSVTFTDATSSSTGSATGAVKKDGTPPTNVHADAPGGANGAGWYRSPLTFQFTGTDATSGISSCSSVGYNGPDSGAASVSGSCVDNAGNRSGNAPSATIKYDASAPTVTGVSTGRSPDSNGWFNHPVSVALQGTDNGPSGINHCDGFTYSGPDTNGNVGGQCVDNAGNAAGGQVAFKYDATPPSVSGQPARGPDGNGWFNHAVTINFGGSDAASGIASCSSTTYNGPETGGTTLNGTCTDNAGNTGSGTYGMRFDTTPPGGVTANLARGPDANGWYNHPLGITFSGSDGLSGIASCTSMSYNGPDSAGATATGSCTDNAGNTSAPLSKSFQFDDSPPSVQAQPSRAPDSGTWYNHAVGISFVGSDGGSGVASCSSTSYGGPDGGGIGIGGSCADHAGNTGTASMALNYDATPPTSITGKLDRTPDHNGWYNHPVNAVFSGSDSTSGGVSCTNTAYKGPDTADAKVSGSCRDAAGNSADGGTLDFKYKATPPSISGVTVGVNDQFVTLAWKVSQDATSLKVMRKPGKDGADSSVLADSALMPSMLSASIADRDVTNGVVYEYTIEATDDAGNVRDEVVSVAPSAVLFSPARNAVVSAPPLLAWRALQNVSYYNLQLFFLGKRALSSAAVPATPADAATKGRKVLSVWPVKSHYHLAAAWRYGGKKIKLAAGRYAWYVWPGYGKRKAHKYGPLMGQSAFTFGKR